MKYQGINEQIIEIYLHKIAHFRVEMRVGRRLVKYDVSHTLDS